NNTDNREPEPFIPDQQTLLNHHLQPTSQSSNHNQIQIIPSKHFTLKPIHSQQPLLQIHLLPHHFYIFTHPETHATSILYRPKDGKYGLIQTT
ncbi:sigma 54 modulation/S30EA ribosomal C-terminal domain-containing protein, partial [Staphylococcus hominis]|uniref:sigma 54 modulation/S30EA ribosomal C-terminal domain-containing protein n=1 Tax=Staphylococcus hominis TaxID=1290 RepID=UPI001643DA68